MIIFIHTRIRNLIDGNGTVDVKISRNSLLEMYDTKIEY